MTGKTPFNQLIEPAEAMEMFKYADMQEMKIATDLNNFYWKKRGSENIRLWDAMKLLSFIYGTGRIQGMREERARRKERYNRKNTNI